MRRLTGFETILPEREFWNYLARKVDVRHPEFVEAFFLEFQSEGRRRGIRDDHNAKFAAELRHRFEPGTEIRSLAEKHFALRGARSLADCGRSPGGERFAGRLCRASRQSEGPEERTRRRALPRLPDAVAKRRRPRVSDDSRERKERLLPALREKGRTARTGPPAFARFRRADRDAAQRHLADGSCRWALQSAAEDSLLDSSRRAEVPCEKRKARSEAFQTGRASLGLYRKRAFGALPLAWRQVRKVLREASARGESSDRRADSRGSIRSACMRSVLSNRG